MTMKYLSVSTAPLCVAAPAMASQPLGSRMGVDLGGVVGTAVGNALPFGIGGVAAIAALSLIAGIQLVKRKKK